MRVHAQADGRTHKKVIKRCSENFEISSVLSFNELTKRRRASFESTSSLNIASIKVSPRIPILKCSSIKSSPSQEEKCSISKLIDDENSLDFHSISYCESNNEKENVNLFDEVISPFKRRTISKGGGNKTNRSFSKKSVVASRKSTLESKAAICQSTKREAQSESSMESKPNLLQQRIIDERIEETPEKPFRLSDSLIPSPSKTPEACFLNLIEDDLFLSDEDVDRPGKSDSLLIKTMDEGNSVFSNEKLQSIKSSTNIGEISCKAETLSSFFTASQFKCPATQENESPNLPLPFEIFYTPPKPFSNFTQPATLKRELFDDLEESSPIKWHNPCASQETIVKNEPQVPAPLIRRRGTIESDITIVDGPTQLAARRGYEIDESSQGSSRSSFNENAERRSSMSLFIGSNHELPPGFDDAFNATNPHETSFRRRALTGLPLTLQNYFSAKRSEQNIERRKRQTRMTAIDLVIDENKTRQCWGVEFLSSSRGEIIRRPSKNSSRPSDKIHSTYNSLRLSDANEVIIDPTFL
ncbi:unnamed protein product, partial [Mesorhabditis belari]|uniref:Uncharacterized protein n=1 Tax=Mesorhabditis belari TaxID=2138241 RepID=A0AAF3F486_9BILA